MGSEIAERGTFPSLAYIRDQFDESVSCTGTVVSADLVLTAGHCVEIKAGGVYEPSGFEVFTGSVDWRSAKREASGVSRILINPNYIWSGRRDVALLQLTVPTKAPPIALANSKVWKAGTSVEIAGWGRTYPSAVRVPEELHYADTLVQSESYCRSRLPSAFQPGVQLCTIDPPEYEVGACYGDDGGPLLALRPGTKEVIEIGILHATINKCETLEPNIFTRSDFVAGWVAGHVKELSPGGPPPNRTRRVTMTPGQAATHARKFLENNFASVFRRGQRLEMACRKVGPGKQRCSVSWTRLRDHYSGSVTSYFRLEGGRGVWAETSKIEQCRHRASKHRPTCKLHVKRS